VVWKSEKQAAYEHRSTQSGGELELFLLSKAKRLNVCLYTTDVALGQYNYGPITHRLVRGSTSLLPLRTEITQKARPNLQDMYIGTCRKISSKAPPLTFHLLLWATKQPQRIDDLTSGCAHSCAESKLDGRDNH
jgi:hypothetical protein